MSASHTPGPWMVMGDPGIKPGLHPFHDHRFIVTADAEVEHGPDPRPDQWCLSEGSIICTMKDCNVQNAHLIAAAPELLEALKSVLAPYDSSGNFGGEEWGHRPKEVVKALELLARIETPAPDMVRVQVREQVTVVYEVEIPAGLTDEDEVEAAICAAQPPREEWDESVDEREWEPLRP